MKQSLPCCHFLVSINWPLPASSNNKVSVFNLLYWRLMWRKPPTHHKVNEAGNAEADASEDSGKHETSWYTDTKDGQKGILRTKDNDDKLLVVLFCW